MTNTKSKAVRRTTEELIASIPEWGPSKYGVLLRINGEETDFSNGCSLDVEDNEAGEFVGLGIYEPLYDICYYYSDWEMAKQLTIPKFIAHNGVSDLRKLQKWGFKIDEKWLYWDTQLMAHVLDSTASRGFGLKDLAEKQLGIIYPTYKEITGRHKIKCPKTEPGCCGRVTLDKQPLELVAAYNAMDCYATWALYKKQEEEALKNKLSVAYHNTIEAPVSFLFEAMTAKGISVDLPYLVKLKAILEQQKHPIEKAIKNEIGDINLGSPKQLLEALHAKQIQPTFKGKPSTDKRALDQFRGNPIVDGLLNYSELDTLLSYFILPYLVRNEDVVHPQFSQCGTRTGRPSCSNPNLLQIPKRSENGKRIRKMFVAREGCSFGEADYKEGEPRMLAHLSKDPAMIQLFVENRGFHDYFAEHLNISRDKAKVFDLETYYRATKFGVAKHLGCSLRDAQKRIDEAWNLFPTLYDWEQRIIYEAARDGYITTLMGRRIRVEDLDSNNPFQKEAAERQAMNNIAQASLQECMKMAMIGMDKAGINMLVQVYDSILIEEPTDVIEERMSIATACMENSIKLDVPLAVSAGIGRNWEECKA